MGEGGPRRLGRRNELWLERREFGVREILRFRYEDRLVHGFRRVEGSQNFRGKRDSLSLGRRNELRP